MKKIILFTGIILVSFTGGYAQLKAHIDERFELLSIVFSLAEAEEFMDCGVPEYKRDISEYFNEFKEHKLISLLKQFRQNNGIGYDAVANISAFLAIENNSVIVLEKKNADRLRIIDPRWNINTLEEFISLLNDFYRESEFNSFYNKHSDFHEIATERLNVLLKQLNFDWFNDFFGSALDELMVIGSLTNGPHNYAFEVPGDNFKHGLVIGAGSDINGLPAYPPNMIFIVLHEILHGYTNEIIESSWDTIVTASEKIYHMVEDQMMNMAYNNAKTTMIEWLNNLFTVCYFNDNPDPDLEVELLLKRLQESGFIWMDRSFIYLKHFYDNRIIYSSIYEFVPSILDFINYLPNIVELIVKEFNDRRPYIVDFFPINTERINDGFKNIIFTFSEPMFPSHGIKPVESTDVLHLPWIIDSYWEDNTTYVVPLTIDLLETDKTYGFELIKEFFQNEKYYMIESNFKYTFKVMK